MRGIVVVSVLVAVTFLIVSSLHAEASNFPPSSTDHEHVLPPISITGVNYYMDNYTPTKVLLWIARFAKQSRKECTTNWNTQGKT